MYDVSFFTRIDGNFVGSFPVTVRVKSPSGRKFEEQVYWDALEQEVLYRSGIRPSESGNWEFSLYVDNIKGLRGMGLVCKEVE